MSATMKTVIALVLTGGAIYATYHYLVKPKENKLAYLWENGFSSGPAVALRHFETGFVSAWYDAAKANNQTFDYQGKTYMTKGGRAKTMA